MVSTYRKFYEGQTEEIEDPEETVEDILGNINFETMPGVDGELNQLQQARLGEVLARTKWIEQKLEKRKQELYQEWCERFFIVFAREFGKFKNSLIDLRLEDAQLTKLKENLEFAISNMEDSLMEIYDEYMAEEDEEEITDL
jgi:hypothetical protein